MINLERIGVHLPQGYLFKDISVQINKGDKIGLVGKNGAGKSTMLKLISGENKPSEGTIHKPKDATIGYLTQDIKIDTAQSVFEYLNTSNPELTKLNFRIDEINHELVTRTDYESDSYLGLLDELNDLNHEFSIRDGFLWEEKITNTLKGLGFSDKELPRSLNTFSGGWKMRAELAKILVNNPDFEIIPGQLMTAKVIYNELNQIGVPESAVTIQGDTAFVYVVINNVAEKKNVEIGKRNFGKVSVLSGISEGEIVISEGVSKVRNKVKVKIIKPTNKK